MKRKSREVQKALEMDLEILRNMAVKVSSLLPVCLHLLVRLSAFFLQFCFLLAQKDEEIALKTTRREKARADADYMRQVLYSICFKASD
jgi:hypothetical protein